MRSQDGAAEEPMKEFEMLRGEDEDEKSQSMVDVENGIFPAKAHDEDQHDGKNAKQPSLELTRTVSNALSRVTTRMTNRHIIDPGPPPGIHPHFHTVGAEHRC